MKRNDSGAPYEVGFGKPPKRTRFRPGTSGNPAGRPKGKKNLATVLDRALQEKVIVSENGIRKTITKLEASVTQLVNKSASGDLNAMRQLTALSRSAEDSVTDVTVQQPSEPDTKVLQGILKRWEDYKTGDVDENQS